MSSSSSDSRSDSSSSSSRREIIAKRTRSRSRSVNDAALSSSRRARPRSKPRFLDAPVGDRLVDPNDPKEVVTPAVSTDDTIIIPAAAAEGNQVPQQPQQPPPSPPQRQGDAVNTRESPKIGASASASRSTKSGGKMPPSSSSSSESSSDSESSTSSSSSKEVAPAAVKRKVSKHDKVNASSSKKRKDFSNSEIKVIEMVVKAVKEVLVRPDGVEHADDMTLVIRRINRYAAMYSLDSRMMVRVFIDTLNTVVRDNFCDFLYSNEIAIVTPWHGDFKKFQGLLPLFFNVHETPDAVLDRFMKLKYKPGTPLETFLFEKEQIFIEFLTAMNTGELPILRSKYAKLARNNPILLWCVVRSLSAATQKDLAIAMSQVPAHEWTLDKVRFTLTLMDKARTTVVATLATTTANSSTSSSSSSSHPKGNGNNSRRNGGNNKAASNSTPSSSSYTSSAPRERRSPPGPCPICQGDHWKNECTKKPQVPPLSPASDPNNAVNKSGKSVSFSPGTKGTRTGTYYLSDGTDFSDELNMWFSMVTFTGANSAHTLLAEIDLFLDTGSHFNLIDEQVVDDLKYPIVPLDDPVVISSATGDHLNLLGKVTIPLDHKEARVPVEFYVVKRGFPVPILLGTTGLKALDVELLDIVNRRIRLGGIWHPLHERGLPPRAMSSGWFSGNCSNLRTPSELAKLIKGCQAFANKPSITAAAPVQSSLSPQKRQHLTSRNVDKPPRSSVRDTHLALVEEAKRVSTFGRMPSPLDTIPVATLAPLRVELDVSAGPVNYDGVAELFTETISRSLITAQAKTPSSSFRSIDFEKLEPNTNIVPDCNVFVNPSLNDKEKRSAAETLSKFTDVFYQDGTIFSGAHGIEHKIPTDGVVNSFPDRRYSQRVMEIIDKQVHEWIHIQVIEPCTTGNYNNPPVVVGKDHGKSTRVCLDFRALNAKSVRNPYTLPRVDEHIEWMAHAQHVTVIDMKSAYLQTLVALEDREKTAFRWRGKRYQFRCMPFGLVGAQDTQQRLMDLVLEPFHDFARSYVDDVTVATVGSLQLHLQHLEDVLAAFREKALYVGTKHVYLAFNYAPALGHVAGMGRILIPADRARAITAMSAPTSKAELASFLGAINFYRKFCKGFSTSAMPLYDLLKKDSEWSWSPVHESSFQTLKDFMVQPAILRTPDYSKPFTLRCDSSLRACGCVLLQEHDGVLMPVLYDSKKFTTAESHWTVTEKECFAVVWSLKRTHVYIDGCVDLIVETDHIALTSILKTKEPSGRLARWVMTLQSYTFQVRHRPGTLMALPDTLSRLVAPESSSSDVATLTTALLLPALPIAEQQDHDNVVKEVKQWVEDKSITLSDAATAFTKELNNTLEVHEGVLYLVPPGRRQHQFVRRVIIPEHMRSDIMKEHHESAIAGHFGFKKTYARLHDKFAWPFMARDVQRYCTDCVDCARAKQTHRRSTGEMHAAQVGYPWRRVYVDFIGPFSPATGRGNKNILIFIEDFTGWPEAFATADQTANTFAEKTLNEIIARHDPPEEFFSDNGSAFIDQGIARMMEIVGSRHLFTATYHPQANASERYNKTLEALLRIMVQENPEDWDLYLPFVLRAMRTAINARTGFSPYKLMYGRDHVSPIDLSLGLREDSQTISDFANEITNTVRISISEATKAAERAREVTEHSLKSREVPHKLQVGQWVLVERMSSSSSGTSSKLLMPYEGPFKVLGQDTLNTYIIDMPAGRTSIHVKRLKNFGGNYRDPQAVAPVAGEIEVDFNGQFNHHTLVGQRVNVYWSTDRTWYPGTVIGRADRQHVILYDDGLKWTDKLIGYQNGPQWKLLLPPQQSNTNANSIVDTTSTHQPINKTALAKNPKTKSKRSRSKKNKGKSVNSVNSEVSQQPKSILKFNHSRPTNDYNHSRPRRSSALVTHVGQGTTSLF